METAQVRLPRPRSTTTVNHRNNNTIPTANTTTVSHTIQANTLPNNYHHYNNNNNYHHYSTSNNNGGLNAQRHYTFPQITPPSAVHAQRSRHARPNETGLVTPVKPVYKLKCRHCSTIVCARGMKAILLADLAIELYSTDTPSQW
jgi:hypothetical protein